MTSIHKTKIVATVGPASRSTSALRTLLQTGVDVFRINGSYESPEDHAQTIARIRAAARAARATVGVLVDLPGPKFRLGKLADHELTLRRGARITLICGETKQRDERIPLPDRRIARALRPGHTLFINDGIVELRVKTVRGMEISCRVIAGGPIRSGKGLNLPRVPVKLPSLTSRDRELARMAVAQNVDYVGLSFVRSSANIKALRRLIGKEAPHVGIVAKIEKPEALDDLENIIDASDAVMVARGDLGIEMPFDQLPYIQKHILERCIAAGRPVITATQMLESMVSASRPTRAEATDVAHAVWEGTDAVMLSEETSIGVDPPNAVRAMSRIAREAEKAMPPVPPFERGDTAHERQAVALSQAACFLAHELGARAIITPTRSGRTPRYVSRSRPHMTVLAPTETERTAQRMCLYWGVIPLPLGEFENVDDLLEKSRTVALKSRFIARGDTVVITSGAHGGKGDITRLVEVERI